jgi:UDP-3-O-[3-hydroxymyristoyl] glucosamine N-acyltransferase
VPVSLGELADRFDCELVGDPDIVVDNVAGLVNAGPRSLSFLSSSNFKRHLAATEAAAVILHADDAGDCPAACLVNENPYAAYALIAAAIHPPVVPAPGVHPSAVVAGSVSVPDTAYVGANAVIEDGTELGEYASIGPGCFVGPNCRIGKHTRLHANVTFVRDVATGQRCIFHSGCVIGADGFGNAMTPEGWVKVPQFGGVRIGDDVEIGSCTSVDCGAIGDTVIGNGVRLDNQIQIGHNVQIGEHTAMAASCAIAGSAIVGKRCMFAGMVGMAGHIEVCDDVIVNGKGMISKSITEPGAYASNFPIEPVRDWNRSVAMVRRLGKLTDRVSKLEKGRK